VLLHLRADGQDVCEVLVEAVVRGEDRDDGRRDRLRPVPLVEVLQRRSLPSAVRTYRTRSGWVFAVQASVKSATAASVGDAGEESGNGLDRPMRAAWRRSNTIRRPVTVR
jgi:hypothetical protein